MTEGVPTILALSGTRKADFCFVCLCHATSALEPGTVRRRMFRRKMLEYKELWEIQEPLLVMAGVEISIKEGVRDGK